MKNMGTHYFHTLSPWHPLLRPRCSLLSWELAAAERPLCGRIWSSSVAGDGLIFQWATKPVDVVGFKHGCYLPFHIWDVILPIDELIFFKMVIAPPTSLDVLSWRWLLDYYIIYSSIIPVVFLISTKKRSDKFPIRSMFNLPLEQGWMTREGSIPIGSPHWWSECTCFGVYLSFQRCRNPDWSIVSSKNILYPPNCLVDLYSNWWIPGG